MYISHLSLTNFRNYSRLELELPDGPALLHGANAQGKTNLLEAIFYLATARSPHADQEQQLINWDALQAEEPVVVGRLVGQLTAGAIAREIEIRLIKESQRGQSTFRREALVDRRKVRLMDLLGKLRVVLFLPQDVQLITGPPARRRRYLDVTLCQTDPIYCRNLSAYNKVLEQRNALLRRIAENGQGIDLMPVYDEKLVELGAQILARRAAFVGMLAKEAQRVHYEKLTDGAETIRLGYLPRLSPLSAKRTDDQASRRAAELGEWVRHASHDEITERFQEQLSELRQAEVASGSTRVGPHRDDWLLWVNGRSLSSYGSRGQQRSAILALKLAEIDWMAGETGDRPVLLLDEVVAELDESRRSLLLETVLAAPQAVLTATDPGMLTADFLERSTTMTISEGRVYLDRTEAVTP